MLPSPDQIRSALAEHGLDHLWEAMQRTGESGVAFWASGRPVEALPIGRSKLAGEPDLPADQNWPESGGRHLDFIAQFDLREIRGMDGAEELPDSGILSIFLNYDEQPWGTEPEDAEQVAVLYLPPGVELERRPTPDDLKDPDYGSVSDTPISFASSWTPGPSGFDIGPDSNYDQWAEFKEAIEELFPVDGADENGDPSIHQLLGGSWALDPKGLSLPEEAGELADDWILLAQFGCWYGAVWGDMGRMHLTIPKHRLEARDFSLIWPIMQSS